jgi:hypothetical protein
MSLRRNQELADKLWQKAQSMPDNSNHRCALLVAAKNIERHPVLIETDRHAREVKGVGPKIVQELVKLGLQVCKSQLARSFVEGADAIMPARKRRAAAMWQSSPSSARCERNAIIANALRARAGSKPGGIWAAMNKAANNIEQWPAPIETVQHCFAVPGVSAYLANVITTEILHRELTDEERAYLAGAEVQAARLSGTRPRA